MKLILLAFLSLIFSFARCQYPNIQIDLQSEGEYAPCEPSIAINPLNTDQIVAGAILNKVYRSNDGGMSWKVDNLKSPYGVYGDPCVIAGDSGYFYYFHLSDPSGKGWSDKSLLDRIVCQKSADGGHTWNEGSYTGLNNGKDQDKEWACYDAKSDRLYCTWTQFDEYGSMDPSDSTNILFSASNKETDEWSAPKRINQYSGNCLDDDKTVEGAVPCAGPDGEIYVSWALGEKIYFDRSLDGGNTWLQNDVEAATIVGGWNLDIPGIQRCNGMPVTKCDLSKSPYRGNIYINFADQRNGKDNTDIWVVCSDNNGQSWSEPVMVNDDGGSSHQFFTWMDVDPATGYIYIVFYDRRNHEDHNTDVYLAVSKDGGKSFSNRKISERPFLPHDDVFFGDYNNIAALNGVVRPIWTRMENRILSIWTALIEEK